MPSLDGVALRRDAGSPVEVIAEHPTGLVDECRNVTRRNTQHALQIGKRPRVE
jgi:hypothetical protein